MLSTAEFGSRGSHGSTVPALLLLGVDVFADPVHAVLPYVTEGRHELEQSGPVLAALLSVLDALACES